MTCKEFKEEISAYLDGLLDNNKHSQFLEHISECQNCRQETEELRAALQWLKQAEPVSPPKNLRSLVISRLSAEQKGHKKRYAPGLYQGVAAAAVLIFLMAGNLLPQYFTPSVNEDPGMVYTADGTIESAEIDKEPAAQAMDTAQREDIRLAAEEPPPAAHAEENAVLAADESDGSFINLRNILNLSLIFLFLFLTAWGLKKHREALP